MMAGSRSWEITSLTYAGHLAFHGSLNHIAIQGVSTLNSLSFRIRSKKLSRLSKTT